MDEPIYLTAREAADRLGIKVATLYSYVSRGWVRSEAADERRRMRRYRLEDIQKLKAYKEGRRDPAKAVGSALDWGMPVLESAITLIDGGRYFYRGRDVLALAEQYPVEQVAALIWSGALEVDIPGLIDPEPVSLSDRLQGLQTAVVELPPIERFQILLPAAAQEDLSAYDLRPAAVMQTGARILHLLAAIAVGKQSTGRSVAQTLQQQWIPHQPSGIRLINAALIMCADHELNVSSFTARCVASAEATLYDVVIAGLSALKGVRHGRNTERVEAFLKEVGDPQAARAVVAGRLRRGEPIPGFGHQLYPAGDPRGRALLDLICAGYPDSPAVALADAVVSEVEQVTGEHYTIDLSLVALAWAMELPPGSALTLFALGRTIGWIGQAIEQYQLGKIIRPRAHYVGELPMFEENYVLHNLRRRE